MMFGEDEYVFEDEIVSPGQEEMAMEGLDQMTKHVEESPPNGSNVGGGSGGRGGGGVGVRISGKTSSDPDPGAATRLESEASSLSFYSLDSASSSSSSTSSSQRAFDFSREMLDFASFELRPELVRALRLRRFDKPTSAQMNALPVAMAGSDMLLQSREASGKTAVYALAALHTMTFTDQVETLVIVPTRELAVQVAGEFELFAKYLPQCRVQAFFGGRAEDRDKLILKQKLPNVVVGTPGRLVSLMANLRLHLRRVTHFIIDECDKVLSPGPGGMSDMVRRLLDACPEDRQVMMFTGTIDKHEADRERRLLRLMHCPQLLLVDDPQELALRGVKQFRVTLTSAAQKTRTLLDVLDRIDYNQVVIFVNTVERCHVLCSILAEEGLSCLPLHSSMSQAERLENYEAFKNFRRRLLVATDLMGRGIDYEFVSCVINYDVPQRAKTYLHRIGRTGRMLKRGIAVSLCLADNESPDFAVLGEVETHYATTIAELPAQLDNCITNLAS